MIVKKGLQRARNHGLLIRVRNGDFQTYTFDPVGNRMSLRYSRGTQLYSYDEADELLEVESDFNPEEPEMRGKLLTRLGASDSQPLFKTTYGWDADGNQVSKTGPGNKASHYDFDALDRLAGISSPGSKPVQYRYNADRQRIATVHGKDAVSERFLHLGRGRQVLGDLDGQGKMTKRYILLPSGQLIAHVDTSANKPVFYHFDALGSTVVMSDRENRLIARFSYGPYGMRLTHPEGKERYGYVGRDWVSYGNEGLLFMARRFYAPNAGLFLSVEPLFRYGQRRYTYALSNPVSFIDPSGLVPEKAQYLACVATCQLKYADALLGAADAEMVAFLISGVSGGAAAAFNAAIRAGLSMAAAYARAAFVGGATAGGCAFLSISLGDFISQNAERIYARCVALCDSTYPDCANDPSLKGASRL
jgi:RHS repeat-associated protein